MAKTIEEHKAEMEATFDRWYAEDEDVALVLKGLGDVLDHFDTPLDLKLLMAEGVGMVARKAFGAGGEHGAKLSMELTADKFKDLCKKG